MQIRPGVKVPRPLAMLLKKRVLLPVYVLAWAAMIACASRPPAVISTSPNDLAQPRDDSSQQPAPFHDAAAPADTKDQKSAGKIETASILPAEKLPAGTAISVALQSSISSATAVAGQSFEAVLDQPLVVDGVTIAPKGAPVTGRVVAARSSGRFHKPGFLRLTLTGITLHGQAVQLETSSVFVQGGSHEKRNLAFIGGGAGAGALLGAVAGGGKGALIGSAVGAGAGATGVYATGHKDVGFNAERRLTFRLAHDVPVSS
ncbi:MAG TPA: hypothetical protein VE998_07430 [Terriglobales bacterium]|nr:hypothetical protein [Terriglobales bacterium]